MVNKVAQNVSITVSKEHPIRAALSGVVTLAAYLVGVIPAEGGVQDLSQAQWLGAVVFLGIAYGLYPAQKDTADGAE